MVTAPDRDPRPGRRWRSARHARPASTPGRRRGIAFTRLRTLPAPGLTWPGQQLFQPSDGCARTAMTTPRTAATTLPPAPTQPAHPAARSRQHQRRSPQTAQDQQTNHNAREKPRLAERAALVRRRLPGWPAVRLQLRRAPWTQGSAPQTGPVACAAWTTRSLGSVRSFRRSWSE
jgi:hypothetical protein